MQSGHRMIRMALDTMRLGVPMVPRDLLQEEMKAMATPNAPTKKVLGAFHDAWVIVSWRIIGIFGMTHQKTINETQIRLGLVKL